MDKLNFKIKRVARAKKLSMRFVGTELVISAPLYALDFEINRFVERSRDWISSRIENISTQPKLFSYDWVILWGKKADVKLIKGRITDSYLDEIKDNIIDTENKKIIYLVTSNDFYISRLKRFLHGEFMKESELLLVKHCKLMGIFRLPKLRIKEMRSRWGSFSSRNNINLNWRLVFAPIFVLEYVIVHELCHYFEMNHSSRFWNLVKKYCCDYLLAERYLKNNSLFLNQNFLLD